MISHYRADSTVSPKDDISQRARAHLEQRTVPISYRGDRQVLLDLLARILATELTCMLRYKQHYFTAYRLNAGNVHPQFNEHSRQKLEHAFALAERIVQLGGQPDLNPKHIDARSHVKYVTCDTVEEMLRDNLEAERTAIEHYRQTIDFIGADDPNTRHLLEDILAVKERHAESLLNLLNRIE